ncbi:MAG TPA: serine/threonine-protein kinase, partial [Polyangiaceae bacterium]|nr:serine/threonine-protein kinase [Polyangiaceae bacterium]
MSDSAEERAQALVGTTLGKGYELQALIGQGAMGAVYRARAGSGEDVAIKTLRPEAMGEVTSQRFLRESELVRGLKHPHVVRTLDAGADEATGLMYLVMPLLKGRDLDHVLTELAALEPETAVRIALQAARGLTAAHRIGIIHRDVKPGNLILDEEDGEIIVRVCDFGIAKQIGQESELTKTGSQLGTPDYVSPEQLKSSKHVDERTDIWSLGATLYQMLCGAAPFAHVESVFDLITAIVTEDVPHLQDRAPWIDTSLALVVHKALQRDPNERWATLEDMADALRPFSGGDELLDPARIVSVSPVRRKSVANRADLREAPKQTSLLPAPTTEMDELGLTNQSLDGRYLVKRLIGKGGMGIVYEVESQTGEHLAAKVVSAGVQGATPQTLQRFAREAKASSAINSLNVARTVDAGCDDKLGFPYIIMELLSGVDLSSVMKQQGALSPEIAARLVVQAARGVAAAHARGVVHRDIKPANLFLQQDPKTSEITVKVCDFGVAKRLSGMSLSLGGSQFSLTRSGGMLGSPMYMSPEQARNAKAVDERTDVWSLSVVLWELLSGHRLWGGQKSLGELIVAICTEPIRRLEDLAPWVPRELSRVVHHGLERDPEKRIPSARALIEQLTPHLAASDRVVMRQLGGLTEEQRGELTLRVSLTDSAARRMANLSVNLGKSHPPRAIELGPPIADSRPARPADGEGVSKSAMFAVALLSAAVAGGGAYFFARGSNNAANTAPAATPAPAA